MVHSASRRASITCCNTCFEDSYVSPSLLHFSSLLWHNFSVLLRCLGRTLASHVRLGSQIYRLRLTGSVLQILPSNVGFTLRFCCRESFRSVSARSPSPMVFRSRCQPPPSKPLGAILRWVFGRSTLSFAHVFMAFVVALFEKKILKLSIALNSISFMNTICDCSSFNSY